MELDYCASCKSILSNNLATLLGCFALGQLNPNNNSSIYVGLVVLFAASLLAIALLPHGSFLQAVAAVPLVGSLVVALFKVLRDLVAHERQLLLLDSQQRFALGASSHMANVAFDKHVAFSEEYISEVFKTLDTLFREGPTQEALSHAASLFALRRKYAVWLTRHLDSILQRFEGALRKVGANDWFLRNVGPGEPRQKQIEEMYKTFADILGQENMGNDSWQGQALSEDVAISGVIQGLRAVLGTEELTQIRGAIVQKALEGVKNG